MTATRKTETPWDLAKAHGWEYTGDSNLENGGMFYRFPDGADGPEYWPASDYADAVEVIDLESATGAPSGAYWINRGPVYMPKPWDSFYSERLESILATCGYSLESADKESGAVVILDGAGGRVTGPDAARLALDAFRAYWGQEAPDLESLALGAACRDEWREHPHNPTHPDTVLRAGSNLGRYIARAYLD